jgi:hypothetical protein
VAAEGLMGDDQETAGPPDAECGHIWSVHVCDRVPVEVRTCKLCGEPDWDVLAAHLAVPASPAGGRVVICAALVVLLTIAGALLAIVLGLLWSVIQRAWT